jgi:hypothetical protein
MRRERGRPLGFLIGTGTYPWQTVDLARMGNQETEQSWSLKTNATPETGRRAEPREREKQPKTPGESDHLILLRDGRADHMGKGVTVMRTHQRQPLRDKVGPDIQRTTLLVGISMGRYTPSARVSMAEEPGAGKPHAGICAGGAG